MSISPRQPYFMLATAVALVAAALPFAARAQAADPNAGVEAQVRAEFADVPDMILVAKCESGFRQFSADGAVLWGGSGKAYIGIFQIGERLHAAPAAAMGQDIFTIEGNIAYARHLYGQRGIQPWRECAPMAAAPAPSAPVAPGAAVLTADLVLGMKGEQVRTLQRMLNAKGYAVAASGAGAAGSETTTFGSLTRDALRRFQCAKAITCEGSEKTTGYGRLGPRTRAALLQD